MAGRRHFTRTLLAIQVGVLACLAVVAAVVVAHAARDAHHLAGSGDLIVWWDTRAATMAAIIAGLGLYLLVSFILPTHREGVRR